MRHVIEHALIFIHEHTGTRENKLAFHLVINPELRVYWIKVDIFELVLTDKSVSTIRTITETKTYSENPDRLFCR